MSNMNCSTHKPPPVLSLFPKNVGCSQGSFSRFKSSELVSMLIIRLKPEKKVVDFSHWCLRLIVSAHGSWLVLIGAYGCKQIIMGLPKNDCFGCLQLFVLKCRFGHLLVEHLQISKFLAKSPVL